MSTNQRAATGYGNLTNRKYTRGVLNSHEGKIGIKPTKF